MPAVIQMVGIIKIIDIIDIGRFELFGLKIL